MMLKHYISAVYLERSVTAIVSFIADLLQIRDIEMTTEVHSLFWGLCLACLMEKNEPRDEYIWKSMVIVQSLPEYDVCVALNTLPKDFHTLCMHTSCCIE